MDRGRVRRRPRDDHGRARPREHPPRSPRQPTTITIDAAWLRTEYLDNKRTLAAIGRQLGTAPTNVARVARKHGIPLRSRGGASHASNLAAPDDTLPHPLAVAIIGQYGPERVCRYQLLARSPSIRQAALAMGWNPPTLYTQLKALEHTYGGSLINRHTPTREHQKLTPLGKALLDQADDHLGTPTSSTSTLLTS